MLHTGAGSGKNGHRRTITFDLTIEQAQGAADPRSDADDWGYYFIIQQLPGEPRFGMDLAFEPDDDPATPITWNTAGTSSARAA
jgi:hypothetical protein